MIMTLLLFIPVGICMGLTAGLFGIGGGMFAVPFMVIIFENSGYSGTPIPQMAVVTAMAITSCTTLISAQTHRKLHWEVMLRNIKKIVAGLMLGSFLGTLTLVNISGELVKIFVSLLLLWVGTSFLSSHANDRTVFLRHIPLPFGGVIIGTLSALFGIAGGLLTIPLLKGHGLNIKQAVAVASGTGFIVSFTAVLASAAISAWDNQPPLQYVHPLAFFTLAIAGGIFSHISSRYQNKIDHDRLKRYFAIFVLCLSAYLMTDTAIDLFV